MAEKYQVLTIRDLSKHLKIGEKTIYTLVQNGTLPGFKVGGQWRFRSHDVERWIDSQTAGNSLGCIENRPAGQKEKIPSLKRGFEPKR